MGDLSDRAGVDSKLPIDKIREYQHRSNVRLNLIFNVTIDVFRITGTRQAVMNMI